jgi:hypothetical protein
MLLTGDPANGMSKILLWSKGGYHTKQNIGRERGHTPYPTYMEDCGAGVIPPWCRYPYKRG